MMATSGENVAQNSAVKARYWLYYQRVFARARPGNSGSLDRCEKTKILEHRGEDRNRLSVLMFREHWFAAENTSKNVKAMVV
jgi:hypothetical protein